MRGAYGFELLGAGGASAQLVEGEPDWPLLEIERHTGAASLGRSFITADRGGDRAPRRRLARRRACAAARDLHDGTTALRRRARSPLSRPRGRNRGVLARTRCISRRRLSARRRRLGGHRRQGVGEGSLLAVLARRGHGIVADDALVVERDVVFAEAAKHRPAAGVARVLDAGESIGTVGGRERWLPLDPVATTSRLEMVVTSTEAIRWR